MDRITKEEAEEVEVVEVDAKEGVLEEEEEEIIPMQTKEPQGETAIMIIVQSQEDIIEKNGRISLNKKRTESIMLVNE